VKLVRVPAAVFEHAQLREPLGDEVIVVDVTRAGERPGNFRRPLDLDLNRLVRLDLEGQVGCHHRPVIRIPVVRGNEPDRRHQIGGWRGSLARADRRDVHCPPCIASYDRGATREPAFAQPCGLRVAPGVPVKVKLQLAGGVRADVAPADGLASGERARDRIEPDVDVVIGVARGEAAALRLVELLNAAVCAGRAQHARKRNEGDVEVDLQVRPAAPHAMHSMTPHAFAEGYGALAPSSSRRVNAISSSLTRCPMPG
jgi:hypothetical protein